MNYIGKVISNISQAYNEINPATLTGSIDVIIVEQEDGSYLCSPFHVRFGKMGVIRSKEKIVDIEINGFPVDIHMKLGDSGEAYFCEECDADDESDEDNEEYSKSPFSVQSDTFTKEEADTDNDTLSDTIDGTLVSDKSSNNNTNDNCDKPNAEFASDNIGKTDTSKSVSTTSLNTQTQEKLSNGQLKRIRRKKKNRSTSKQSAQGHESIKSAGPEPSNESSLEQEESGDETAVSGKSHHYSDNEFHPFSDSEVNTINYNVQKYIKQDSIGEPYDCKSDSEYEIFKANNASDKPGQDQDNISWDWGELPNVKKESTASKASTSHNNNNDKDSKSNSTTHRSSMLGGFLGFINKDKEAPVVTSDEKDKGIYLDDLDLSDDKVAAKYFPQFTGRSSFSNSQSRNASDEDVESGNGPSLSTSPQSVEFNYPSSVQQRQSLIEMHEFDNKPITSYDLANMSKLYHDMSMSLCGGIENLCSNPTNSEHFLQSIISFDDFSENPLQILDNPNLVVRMGGQYYTWKMASSIILSLLMFQRPLPEKTLESLKEKCIPKKKLTGQPSTSSWRSWWSRSNVVDSNQVTTNSLTNNAQSVASDVNARTLDSSSSFNTSFENATKSSPSKSAAQLEYTSDEETINIVMPSNGSSAKQSITESGASGMGVHKKIKYRKVLRLKSDVIKSLNLKPNSNDVMFSVTTAFQGTTICKSKIFLWRFDDKIVISDIDGTITKSDVLGHILPYIGKDWAQLGVTQLYTNIENNGYKFLYLSARAIGQAKVTRDYLRALRQDDIGLPDGPLLLSPTSLFSALHREVIEKKPEEFKISCLKDIQTLFPVNPFFAGFGNKINDNWAYKAVGIDSSRIFTINPKGELKLERIMSFKSSYSDLSLFVDQMFPPLPQHACYQGYNSFMYWRSEIPHLEEQEIAAKE